MSSSMQALNGRFTQTSYSPNREGISSSPNRPTVRSASAQRRGSAAARQRRPLQPLVGPFLRSNRPLLGYQADVHSLVRTQRGSKPPPPASSGVVAQTDPPIIRFARDTCFARTPPIAYRSPLFLSHAACLRSFSCSSAPAPRSMLAFPGSLFVTSPYRCNCR